MFLKGKIAIITGSSQGIGAGIAAKLAAEGAAVIVNYQKGKQEADNLVTQIREAGGQALAVEADVSRLGDVENLFTTCLREFGRPHILINNAGIGAMATIADTTEETYDRVFGLNVRGTLFCLKLAAQHLENGGRIVNISSSTMIYPQARLAIYASSKAAVKTISEVAAFEFGERGITVNSVMPGVTETSMSSRLPEDFRQSVAATSPFGRLGKPEDIAGAVALLLHDDAHWITGQHIVANGGGRH